MKKLLQISGIVGIATGAACTIANILNHEPYLGFLSVTIWASCYTMAINVQMNPHPTKSKPCKIGRKHTGAPSSKQKAKRARKARLTAEIATGKIRSLKKLAADYWSGKTDRKPK